MPIDIISGHDLPDTLIELMNHQRIKEYQVNTKNFRRNEQDSTFFFVKDKETIKAFGMLKPVTLIHQGQTTTILGIGNIIAREKDTGQGRRLMTAIQDYLTDKRRIGIGFCGNHVVGFYRACGYTVDNDLSTRFRYPLAPFIDMHERLTDAANTLYYDPLGGLDDILQSDDLIHINQPFW